MIKDLFEQLKNKIDSNSHTESESDSASSSPVSQLTTEKIKAIVADLSSAEPIFKEAGFIMEQLEIEIGLIPKVTPQFLQLKKVSVELENELLQRLNDRQLLKFILQSLFKSSRMNALLESTDLSIHAIEIDISAPPSVRTIFRRQHTQVGQGQQNESSQDIDITRH